ncbi:hypothetical protein [Bartonella sp. B30(2025)]
MVNFNNEYRENLKYWLACIIGLVTILAIIVIGGFYIAKPHLDSFVKRELARRSIQAIKSEVSLTGKVNLRNVIIPVPANMTLRIGALSARPPISFIPGAFTLYDVYFTHNNIHVKIPKISINGISLKEKNATITSRLLQSIMRVKLSSVVAPNILIFTENKNKLTEKIEIKDFQLYGLKNGHIQSFSGKKLNLEATVENGVKKTSLIAKSDIIKAHNIDVHYAYSILFGKSNTNNQGKTIIGPIALDNMAIDVFEGTEKNVSVSLGKFRTSGLKMKPLKQTPEELIKAYLRAKKENNKTTQKTALHDAFMSALLAITSIDTQIDKFSIDIAQLKATFDSFQLIPSQWEQPIPQKLLLSLNNLSILPKKMKEKDLDFLKKLHLEPLNLSGKLDVSYNEKNREILLNTMSFNIKNAGSAEIFSKIINIDGKLFSGKKYAMLAAVQNFGITEVDIRYTDAGFIDKLFSYLAQKFNDNKYDLKKELYDDFYLIMTQSPKILLKNHATAENISQSFGEFAKNPQTLIIKITAKDNRGLMLPDFQAVLQNGLLAILNKVNLTVKNESLP